MKVYGKHIYRTTWGTNIKSPFPLNVRKINTNINSGCFYLHNLRYKPPAVGLSTPSVEEKQG